MQRLASAALPHGFSYESRSQYSTLLLLHLADSCRRSPGSRAHLDSYLAGRNAENFAEDQRSLFFAGEAAARGN